MKDNVRPNVKQV